MAQDDNKDEAVLDEEQKLNQASDESTEDEQNTGTGQTSDDDDEAVSGKGTSDDESTVSHRLEKRIERQLGKLMSGTSQQVSQEDARQKDDDYKPLDYAQQEEFDRNALEADRTKYGDTQRRQGESEAFRRSQTYVEQTRFLDRLENDRERVATKYPELDEENDNFDPTLTDALNKMYIATVGHDKKTGLVKNPGIRYKDYVETFLAVADKIKSKASEDTVRNVTRQATRSGVKPQGQRARSSSKTDFSDLQSMSGPEWEKNKAAYYADVNRRLGIA